LHWVGALATSMTRWIAVAATTGLIAAPALAIMAGIPPDAPETRVDPNTANSPWAGVGAVLVDDAVFSGVAIGPRLVLTAAHVVGDLSPSRIRFQINASSTPVLIQARQVIVHPGFSGFNKPNLNDDLAIIILDTTLPADVPTYSLNRTQPAPGIELRMVGYGGSGQANGDGRVAANRSVKRVGGNHADLYVTDDDGTGLAEIFYFDFDGVGVQNFIGAAGLGNSIESSMASGDSGSPSFLAASSPPVLFGVNTFLFQFDGGPTDLGTLGTGGGGMVISTYAGWIDSVLSSTEPAPAERIGDVPLPLWLYGLMTGTLTWHLFRARRRKESAQRS